MGKSNQKPPVETHLIICTCGKQIIFATRAGATKPRYITCRNCGKKHST